MPSNDTLNSLLSYIQEQGVYVLATPEDAEYFRKSAKPLIAAPIPIPVEIPVLSPQPPASPKISAPAAAPILVAPIRPAPAAPPQPIERIPQADLSSVRAILSIVAPELAILNDIPSDLVARKISERWKTKNQTAPISILTFQEPPEQKALLEQIAKALDIYFGPAKIVSAESIEKEKQWEAFLSVADLKTIIVCDYTLWQLNNLMTFYKETPAQGTRTLNNTPVFLLPDLSLYLKDPLLKRSLWKALCQKFS